MKITFHGQSCFTLSNRDVRLVIDPFDPDFTGLPSPTLSADIVIVTHAHHDHDYVQGVSGDPFVISGPGEYEVKGLDIIGVRTFHDAQSGAERGVNTSYVINYGDFSVAHMGDLGHELTNAQLDALLPVDVLLIPVGDKYTIGPEQAVKVVQQISPRVVVPMHYLLPGLKFELGELEPFVEGLGLEQEREQVLIVDRGFSEESDLRLVVLESQMKAG